MCSLCFTPEELIGLTVKISEEERKEFNLNNDILTIDSTSSGGFYIHFKESSDIKFTITELILESKKFKGYNFTYLKGN